MTNKIDAVALEARRQAGLAKWAAFVAGAISLLSAYWTWQQTSSSVVQAEIAVETRDRAYEANLQAFRMETCRDALSYFGASLDEKILFLNTIGLAQSIDEDATISVEEGSLAERLIKRPEGVDREALRAAVQLHIAFPDEQAQIDLGSAYGSFIEGYYFYAEGFTQFVNSHADASVPIPTAADPGMTSSRGSGQLLEEPALEAGNPVELTDPHDVPNVALLPGGVLGQYWENVAREAASFSTSDPDWYQKLQIIAGIVPSPSRMAELRTDLETAYEILTARCEQNTRLGEVAVATE